MNLAQTYFTVLFGNPPFLQKPNLLQGNSCRICSMLPSTSCAVLWDTVISGSLQLSWNSWCFYHIHVLLLTAEWLNVLSIRKTPSLVKFCSVDFQATHWLINTEKNNSIFHLYIQIHPIPSILLTLIPGQRALTPSAEAIRKMWFVLFNNIVEEIWIPQGFSFSFLNVK